MDDKIERLAELVRRAGTTPHVSPSEAGRNRFTRTIDVALLWIRRHATPVHWLAAALLGAGLFAYAWLVARTSRLIAVGPRRWPDFPAGCVLALWHGSAPSILGAIAGTKSRPRLVILVATEPRGDALAVLFRLLGLDVVRGDWEHHGWPAMKRIAELVADGACAVITPDGGGPRGVARAGAIVLAAAARVPLVVLGADCRPAVVERRKWDQSRNPVPFSRIVIATEEPIRFDEFEDAAAMEAARLELQHSLERAHQQARQALGFTEGAPRQRTGR